jgi:hypothetical protein
MVEIDCGVCEVPLEPVPAKFVPGFVDEAPVGSYPAQFMACPRCGASWEQRTTGALVKHG